MNLMRYKNTSNTIGQLINRLALQDEIKTSHAVISKLAPLWAQWAKQHISEPCALLYYKNTELTVASASSIGVTQLRHQTKSLRVYLHQHGFKQINKINAVIKQTNPNPNQPTQSNQSITRPSNNAINAIMQCEKATQSDTLAQALRKLNTTLKNI